MNKYGFIGYGKMGSILVEKFIDSGVLKPGQINISSRTFTKIKDLPDRWPGIEVLEDNRSLANKSKYIFLCIEPASMVDVLEEIKPVLDNEKYLISVVATFSFADMKRYFGGKVTRTVPSVTSQVGKGVTLICHNDFVTNNDAKKIEELFGAVSNVKEIGEHNLDYGEDLLNPGILSSILNNYLKLRINGTDLDQDDAQEILINSLEGVIELIRQKDLSFDDIISRAATEGGITEAGVKIINQDIPTVFEAAFKATIDKHENQKDFF